MSEPNKPQTNEETAPVQAPAPEAPAVKPRNLTRESIEEITYSKLLEQGKSPAEARKAAKKRALEVIPE
jgi:hypothetical protein